MSFPYSLNFKTKPLHLELFRKNPTSFTIDDQKRSFLVFKDNTQSLMQMISQINTIKALLGPNLPDFNWEAARYSDFEKMHWEYLFSENLYEDLNLSLEDSLTEAFTSQPAQTIKTALIAEEFFYRELGCLQDAFCYNLLEKKICDKENAISLVEQINYMERLCISSDLKSTILDMKEHIKTQFFDLRLDSTLSNPSDPSQNQFQDSSRKRLARFA